MQQPYRWVLPSLVLSLGLTACASHRDGKVASRPDIIPAEDWGSKPDPMAESREQVPVRITIHHAGVLWEDGSDPYQKIRALQTWGKRDKQWPDVPYHYLIAPDGRIFEGRDWNYEGETNTEYDTNGHLLVQLWGNFDKQSVKKAQFDSAVRLVAWLCQDRAILPTTIRGHRDWSTQTTCPGKDLYRQIQNGEFLSRVQQLLD